MTIGGRNNDDIDTSAASDAADAKLHEVKVSETETVAAAEPVEPESNDGTEAEQGEDTQEIEPTEVQEAECPACGSAAPAGAAWCEACGADLDASSANAVPAGPCVSCGAPPQDIVEGGYCSNCGQKQPAKRDHLEHDEGAVVAVTDRGRRHHRNEDACAVKVLPQASISVVCDGVSSTDRPDDASQAAADTIISIIGDTLASGESGSEGFDLDDHDAIEAMLTNAIAKGHVAVSAVISDLPDAEPPSCTVVAAITRSTPDAALISVAWLGDSRAYWIDEDGSVTALTTDHSWSVDQMALGELTAEEIAADKRAHSITRWLGADATDVTPDIVHLKKSANGRLLLCSDGLWNYTPTETDLADLIARLDEGSALELARGLIDFAIERGGHDNITVALTMTSANHPERIDNGDVQR